MSLIIAAAQSASIAGDISQNVKNHVRFGVVAADNGVQLLIFPELSLTGYELALALSKVIAPDGSELAPLRSLAAEAKMTLVAGGPVWGNGNGKLHIAALAFGPDGSISLYTKEHVHESEQRVFTSGPGGQVLMVEDTAIALAICADASHPQHAAKAASLGANIYAAGVMIEEDAYARKSGLLKEYSRQHSMATLMANYSGVTGGLESAGKSVIYGEEGQLVAASPGAEESLVIGEKQHGVWRGRVIPLS